jgi:hypothetical protein
MIKGGLLRISAGTVAEYSLLGGPQPNFTDEEFQGGNTWRLYPTKPLGEFIATLKEKYRSLQAIPVVRNDGHSGIIRVGGGERDEELEVWMLHIPTFTNPSHYKGYC